MEEALIIELKNIYIQLTETNMAVLKVMDELNHIKSQVNDLTVKVESIEITDEQLANKLVNNLNKCGAR